MPVRLGPPVSLRHECQERDVVGCLQEGPIHVQALNSFALLRLWPLATMVPDLPPGALGDHSHLPFSIRVLLENLLRHEDGLTVKAADVEYLAKWNGKPDQREISFMPARVLPPGFLPAFRWW